MAKKNYLIHASSEVIHMIIAVHGLLSHVDELHAAMYNILTTPQQLHVDVGELFPQILYINNY